MHKSKDLVTLKDWQDKARAKQLAYWDAQQATGTLPTMKQRFYQKLGIIQKCPGNGQGVTQMQWTSMHRKPNL